MQSKYYKTSVELIILYDEVLVEGFLLFHMTLLLGFSLSNYELIAFSNFCLASVLIENMFHKNDVNWI